MRERDTLSLPGLNAWVSREFKMNETEKQKVINEVRIIGTMIKQEWGGHRDNDAIELESETFDATNAILLMPHSRLIQLQDHDQDTDEIGRDHVQWSGPCEVEIVDSIKEFFNVDELEDITEKALNDAKDIYAPVESLTHNLTLSIKVSVKMAPGSDINEFIDNLDYTVLSKTPGIVVKNTEIDDYHDDYSSKPLTPRING